MFPSAASSGMLVNPLLKNKHVKLCRNACCTKVLDDDFDQVIMIQVMMFVIIDDDKSSEKIRILKFVSVILLLTLS